MYDQNDQQGQSGMPQNDQNPYGQLPPNNNGGGALGVAHDQSTQAPVINDPIQPENNAPAQQENSSPVNDDLLSIKQNALQQLNPLVQHLDQSPEEKFKTTMMMIQASDDQSLIKVAYETAGQITDEKARAQALLDIVNEINYFTQQSNS